MNTLGRLVRNAGWSLGADLFGRLANTLLFIVISRELGVGAAGVYSLAISYWLIGSRFAFWGLDHILIRDVARQPDEAERYFVNFLILRAVLGAAAVAILVLIVQLLPYDAPTRTVIVIIALGILPENIETLCRALFIAYERMIYLSTVTFVISLVRLAVSIFLLERGAGLETIAALWTVMITISMLINLFIAFTRFVRPHWRFEWAFCRAQLRIAVPFIFIGMFFILDNRVDIVSLSLLADTHTLGLYSAAATIVTALSMLPQGIRTAIYPVMARYQTRPIEEMTALYTRAFKYLFLIALPLTVGTILIAGDVIDLVYKAPFAEATPVLQVLVLSLMAYSLNVLNSRLLIVHNRQGLIARFLFLSLAANVAFNILLVPIVGATGAAIAKVISAVILFLSNELAAQHYLGRIDHRSLLVRPLVAAAAMAVAVVAVAPLGLAAQVPVAAVTYFAVLFALGAFPREEQLLWRRALTPRV